MTASLQCARVSEWPKQDPALKMACTNALSTAAETGKNVCKMHQSAVEIRHSVGNLTGEAGSPGGRDLI